MTVYKNVRLVLSCDRTASDIAKLYRLAQATELRVTPADVNLAISVLELQHFIETLLDAAVYLCNPSDPFSASSWLVEIQGKRRPLQSSEIKSAVEAWWRSFVRANAYSPRRRR